MCVFGNYKIDKPSIAAWVQGVHLALLMQALGSKKQQTKLLLFCFFFFPHPPLAIILLHTVRDKSTTGALELP